MLLAGLRAFGRTRVTEPAPSRDHTERMLSAFGVEVLREGATVAVEGGQRLTGRPVTVPADFSSAAFFLVAGCLAAERGLLLRNVGVNPTRTGLLEMLRLMGADIRVHALRQEAGAGGEPIADIEVRKSRLKGIRVPESLVPLSIDEFPVFFIAAAVAEGETLVRGAMELRVKESDRLAAMAQGLSVLGVENQLLDDGLWLRGGSGLGGGTIESHGDHRIAMAFAVAGLVARSPIEIRDVANVATSFPGFRGDRPRGRPADRDCMTDAAPVVTIDGPSGSGKGTISRAVAQRVGWHLLDSGALYRLVAYGGLERGLDPGDVDGHARLAAGMDVAFGVGPDGSEQVVLAGRDVTQAIRTETAGQGASRVAAWPPVRTALLERQRAFARPPGLVADGRDMGTVVFPGAPLKITLPPAPTSAPCGAISS